MSPLARIFIRVLVVRAGKKHETVGPEAEWHAW